MMNSPGDMIDTMDATAKDVCVSILNHYLSNSAPSVAAAAGCTLESSTSAPYFDTILGHPMPDLNSTYLLHHFQRLHNIIVESSIPALDAVGALLRCYELVIHPCTRQQIIQEVKGLCKDNIISFNIVVEIVRDYELMVAHAMRKILSTLPPHDGSNTHLREADTENATTVSLISMISDDIFHVCIQWTKNKDDTTLWKVRNMLLPCLLRLIQHAVDLIKYRIHAWKFHDQSTHSIVVTKHALAIATVVAVPFVGDGKLNSGMYSISSLLDWVQANSQKDVCENENSLQTPSVLSLSHTIQSSSIPPITKSNILSQSIIKSDFMGRPVVDFSIPSSSVSASWTDGVTGIGSRAAMNLLQSIFHSSYCINAPSSFIENIHDSRYEYTDCNRSFHLRQLLCIICENIGIEMLVACIRAHFFGRLIEWKDSNTSIFDAALEPQLKTRGIILPMIKRTSNHNHPRTSSTIGMPSNLDEKHHIRLPMRVHAAAILLCSVILPSTTNFITWDTVSLDTVPIALTLLDDIQSIHLTIGALLFISIINAASNINFTATPAIITKFGSVVPRAFECAIQMVSREDPTCLTTLCLAQSKWIRFLCTHHVQSSSSLTKLDYSNIAAMIRKPAAELLVITGKQARAGGRDNNDERIAGTFVAGINPLLTQLASFPNAASIEIARIGLSTILVLIAWSGMSLEVRSAQIAGLAGLISLMNGAYPILPHHGKKIMTELFLLLDRVHKDSAFMTNDSDRVATDVINELAFHAAGISLTICGKSAESILEHIENAKSPVEHLLVRCRKIRILSEEHRSVLR